MTVRVTPSGLTAPTTLHTSIIFLFPLNLPSPMFTANLSTTFWIELHAQLQPMSPDIVYASQHPMTLPLDTTPPPSSVPSKAPPNHTELECCLCNGHSCRSPNSMSQLSSILVTAMPLPPMQNSDHIELDVQPFANTCNGQVQVKVQ